MRTADPAPAPDRATGGPPDGRTLHVAVTSDRSLVAETVRAALAGRGLVAELVPWPGGPTRSVRSASEQIGRVDALLVLTEAPRSSPPLTAGRLLAYAAPHRVALTHAPRGASWGALLASGADFVASAAMTVRELESLLGDVVQRGLRMGADERRDLLDLFGLAELERRRVLERLATLTARESQILHLLYAGHPVRAIADSFAVTEATVRSQVKSLLRKLEVNSQLAAVAVLEGRS